MDNAWLGDLKNVDLVERFGSDEGFWTALAEGIEWIRVEEDHLTVQLRE